MKYILNFDNVFKVDKRSEDCPEVKIYPLPLNDDLQQVLSKDDLRNVSNLMMEELERGSSVIVHCAQVIF